MKRLVLHAPYYWHWFGTTPADHIFKHTVKPKYEFILDLYRNQQIKLGILVDHTVSSLDHYGMGFSDLTRQERQEIAHQEASLWTQLNRLDSKVDQLRFDELTSKDIILCFANQLLDGSRGYTKESSPLFYHLSEVRSPSIIHLSHFVFNFEKIVALTRKLNNAIFVHDVPLTENGYFRRIFGAKVHQLHFSVRDEFFKEAFPPQTPVGEQRLLVLGGISPQTFTSGTQFMFVDASASNLAPFRHFLYEHREQLSNFLEFAAHGSYDEIRLERIRAAHELGGRTLFLQRLKETSIFSLPPTDKQSMGLSHHLRRERVVLNVPEIFDIPTISMLEAMATGAVVISSKSVFDSSMGFEPFINYVPVSNSPRDVLEKCDRMKRDPAYTSFVSANALRTGQRFSSKSSGRRFLETLLDF